MRFHPTRFADAWLIEMTPVKDERGAFARTFCAREFAAQGLETKFVQHSLSSNTRKGTLRGMHFQRAPHEEIKLVRCAKGAVWDVIIDLRPASPTHLQWQGFELSAANGMQLYIPHGFAHGFQTLEDDSEVFYLISEFYAPDAALGVRYDDPRFAIDWPLPVSVISERDRAWPDFVPDARPQDGSG
jgi:dTDP-4-dehydrorhamnose 3,5-epimerase